MYTILPITLFLLFAHWQAILSSAAVLPRPSHALGSAMDRMHRLAARHSAGLAHDIRLAFGGVLARHATRDPATSHRVYCTAPKNSTATSPPSGSPSGRPGTSTVNPSKTSSASAPGATVPPSLWRLVESHVRLRF